MPGDLPSIPGWKPPMCYDIAIDAQRLVTQDDVDRWTYLEQVYGRMFQFLRGEHTALIAALSRKKVE